MKRFSGKTVLIVDDEEALRASLKEEFEFEGATVFEASCGNEASVLARDRNFDVVISDIRMPNGDGVFLLDEIRKRSVEIPVVLFVTGFGDLTLDEAFAKGAEAIFSKPYDIEEIFNTVQRLLTPANARFADPEKEKPKQTVERNYENFETAIREGEIRIGRRGFFLKGAKAQETTGKTSLILRFSQPQPTTIEGQGTIRWIRKEEKEGRAAGLGIEISYLDNSCRAQLEKLMKTGDIPSIPNG